MDRRMLITVNILAIIVVAGLAVLAWTNLEPDASDVLSLPSQGLLLIALVILAVLGYVDMREYVFGAVFHGRRPADSKAFGLLRLLIKVLTGITALAVVLIWAFAWFYMQAQLPWAVIFTGILAAPVVILNLLVFLMDCIVVGNATAIKSQQTDL